MKLAIAHPFLHTKGGAEKVILRIAQHFDATIFCTEYDRKKAYPEFQKLDVEVLPRGAAAPLFSLFPKRAHAAAVAGSQFWGWKAPDEVDVVNTHGTPSEWARHRNSPVVWYCHNPNREAFILYKWRQARRNPLERAVYWSFVQFYKHFEFRSVPKIEHIFCNSKTTQQRIAEYLGRRDAEVLYPGVDVKEFACEGYGKFFFYPSRIVPEKRFELAIEAFEKFRRKSKKYNDWKLVLAGALHRNTPHHTEYYEGLKELVARSENVELLLDMPSRRIRNLYAQCYSVLYTPIHEDFGIVPLEAFASKKPVLAWNEGGPREIVQDGKNGYLVESTDELAEKMHYLAEHPKIAEQMGRDGRKRVEKEFSWGRFLERFGKVCEKVKKRER